MYHSHKSILGKNDKHHITIVNMGFTDAIVACWTLALSWVKNIATVAPHHVIKLSEEK